MPRSKPSIFFEWDKCDIANLHLDRLVWIISSPTYGFQSLILNKESTDIQKRVNFPGKLIEITLRNIMLYPNGTVTYTVRRAIRFLCQFTFELLPFDSHKCPIKVFVVNGDKDQIKLERSDLARKSSIGADTSRANTCNSDLFSNDAWNYLNYFVEFTNRVEITQYVEFTRKEHSGLGCVLL